MHLSLCAPCGDCVNTGLAGCARPVCIVHDHDRGTRDLEPAKLLRLRPKNRLYEKNTALAARARLVSIGRDVRDVLCTYTTVHRSRISVGAGRLAEPESLLLCVTTPSVRAFRPSDARCWLQRVSGAGPSPGGVQHPVPVRRVSVCTFRSAYTLFVIFNIFAMIFTFLRRDIAHT